MHKEKIGLADGNTYTISTLNVGDLINVEQKFGSMEINMGKTENIIYWLWLSLKKEHKDLTIEDLYTLIDAPFIAEGRMEEVFGSLSKVNGWDKQSKNLQSPVEVEKKK